MTTPSTQVSRLSEKQSTSRDRLDELLDSTPLATVALVRDGHPVIFPTGFARVDDELVIHGSTGSPWMRALADGRVGGRRGHRTGRNRRGAQRIRVVVPLSQRRRLRRLRAGAGRRQGALSRSADRRRSFPGRTAELRASTRKELAATLPLRLPIGTDNWSLKVSDGWPEDPDEDIAGDAWAGVVPMSVAYGAPLPAPDLRPGIPLPESVRAIDRRAAVSPVARCDGRGRCGDRRARRCAR